MTDAHVEHSAEPHIVATKVRFDKDGNVVEEMESRYAGPEDIELNIGDGPINGAEFLQKLREDPSYRESVHARMNSLIHPLQTFARQALEATEEKKED
jgi:hypothetical protein